MTTLARGILAAGAGFGLGWFLAGLLGDLMLLGFALGSALGGAALAWGLGRLDRLWQLALAGFLGGGVGFFAGFFVVLSLWDVGLLFVGALGGGLLGAALGVPLRRVAVLALGGAAAFALGFALFGALPASEAETCCTLAQSLANGARLALAGAVGGAILGAIAAKT